MRIKLFVFLIAVLILPMTGLAAQEGSYSFLSFDIGQSFNMNVSDGSLGSSSIFGINVRIADPLTIGVTTYGAASFFNIKYDIIPALRAVLGYGGGQTALGFEIIPFRRQFSGLSTEFKLAPVYTFTGTGIGSGNIRACLLLGIGF
ncbi:MAG: hypothetical protein FWD13_03030 [Treponema sp.]|nr:hypothetical protein [Treponema sp.]